MFRKKCKKRPVIIWDVGGVILEWNTLKFSNSYESGRFQKECSAIFNHENWKKFDRGDLSYDQMIEIYSAELKLSKARINHILQSAFHSLRPNWLVIFLIYQLKEAGYEQYCLTNGSKEYFKYVTGKIYQQAYHFSLHDLFSDEQIILSAKINIAKPEPEIYQYVVDFFKLQRDKIIFIDDNEKNTNAAQAAGWSVVHFKTLDECVKVLKRLKINTDNCSAQEMAASAFGQTSNTAKRLKFA